MILEVANLEACYCVTWIRILWIVSKVYLRPGCADRCYNLSSGLAEICNKYKDVVTERI